MSTKKLLWIVDRASLFSSLPSLQKQGHVNVLPNNDEPISDKNWSHNQGQYDVTVDYDFRVFYATTSQGER